MFHKLKDARIQKKGKTMLKQIFSNLFDAKNAKFGYKLEYVQGYLNHNEIKNLHAGKCELNFENQQMIIVQGDERITDNMTDMHSIRTWAKQRRFFYLEFSTRTHNEYLFRVDVPNEPAFMLMVMKALDKYATAFNVPIEYCGNLKDEE